jgi:hypothetical protein
MTRQRLLVAGGGLVIAAAALGAFFAGRGGAEAGPAPANTPRPIAWLRDAEGSVLVGGTGGGVAASSSTGMRGRDQLATENGAHAVVDLRQSGTLVIGSKAALQVLPEDWDGPRLRPTRVRFLRGTIRAEAGSGVEGLTVDVGDQTVELASGGSAFFAWEGDTLALSMLKAGGLVRTRDGKETVLQAGQGLKLANGALAAAPVALPAALHGGSARDKVYAKNGKARPTFRFPGDQGAVEVLVARDEALTDVVAEASGDAAAVRVEDGLAPGSYFWSAARVDTVSKLTGPYSPSKPITVLPGEGPAAQDESPDLLVVIAGASTRVFYSGDQPPAMALDWAGITDEGSGYEVQIAGDPKMKKPAVKLVTEESKMTLPPIGAGAWFWRVKGPDGRVQAGTFLVKRVSGGPARVARTSRVTEEFDRSQIFFQREAPSVEFSWKPDARAAKYRLMVSRDRGFGNPLLQRDLDDASSVVEAGSLPEGDVFWRVERLKADGGVFYPGKVQTLSLKFDLENPNLELSEPQEGASAGGATVTVSGLAPRESALWVNGVAVAPDRRGRFSIGATLDPAKPIVVVKSARSGKELGYLVRTLRP